MRRASHNPDTSTTITEPATDRVTPRRLHEAVTWQLPLILAQTRSGGVVWGASRVWVQLNKAGNILHPFTSPCDFSASERLTLSDFTSCFKCIRNYINVVANLPGCSSGNNSFVSIVVCRGQTHVSAFPMQVSISPAIIPGWHTDLHCRTEKVLTCLRTTHRHSLSIDSVHLCPTKLAESDCLRD